jgi:acyl carrier protein
MTDRTEVVGLIRQCVGEILAGREILGGISETTRLFGGGGVFDSLGLVTLITEVETQINDQFGASIVIASERAMSQQRSPFRSVSALTDYVMQLLADEVNAVPQP